MRATFFEYHVAMTGLFTAKQNLNVVGHNLANAAMPGFSRQYTLQRASRPLSLGNARGMYGTGSEVYGIAQMRDFYLDNKYWHQKSIHGEYRSKNQHLSLMETIFNELNDANLLSSFNTFFKRLHDLQTTVPDATYRTNVVSAIEALAQNVRTNAEALLKQQQDINREIADTVTIINSLGDQIASLNKQIHEFEQDGSNANDLRDQRALLVDKLSEFVNVEVQEYDFSSPNEPFNKKYTVMINGYDFVNHDRSQPLMVVARENSGATTLSGTPIQPGDKRNEMDAPGLYDIYFAKTGASFNIYSPSLKGSLRGLIDIRDGNNTMSTAVGETTLPISGTIPANATQAFYSTTLVKGEQMTFEFTSPAAGTPPVGTSLIFRPANGSTPITLTVPSTAGVNGLANISVDSDGNWVISDVTELGARGTWSLVNDNTGGAAIPFSLNIQKVTPLSTNNFKGIPFYMNKLNTLVRTFARAMNEGLNVNGEPIEGLDGNMVGHMYAYDYNGQNLGLLMFTYTVDPQNLDKKGTGHGVSDFPWATDASGNPLTMLDYSKLNALNFTINPQLTTPEGWSKLGTASVPEKGESNNDVILDFQKLNSYPHLFKEGRLLDFLIGMSDHMSIDRNQAKNFDYSYEEILMQTDNQRLSVSGVDINEEMMSLVKYQQVYQACAKLVNVINQIYDMLINRLGVG